MEQRLKVFTEVAKHKNFSKAAEVLFMSQPAVSQYIKALEQELGVQLFERTNKYVHLTKPGEVVYQHSLEILGSYKRMQNLIDDLFHEASGELRIGASYTFGEYVLPRVIAELLDKYPNIHPSISIGNTTEIAELVHLRQLDLGIVEGNVLTADLEVKPFTKDQMTIVAAKDHPIVKRDQITPEELEKTTWIIREAGSGTREATDYLFEKLNIKPTHTMEFGSTQIIKESVEAGLGLSFLSQWTIRKELSMESLEMLPVENGFIIRDFSLISRKKDIPTKATNVFIALINKLFK